MSQQNPPSGPWDQQNPQQGWPGGSQPEPWSSDGQSGPGSPWQAPGSSAQPTGPQYGPNGQQVPSGQDGYGTPSHYGQSTPTQPFDPGAQGQQKYSPNAPAGGATGPVQPAGHVGHDQGAPAQYGQPEYPAPAYQQPYGPPPVPGQYGQPAPGQQWVPPSVPTAPRRPVWKTVLGIVFAVIGGMMLLSAAAQLSSGQLRPRGDAAYNFGYILGVLLTVVVPLLLAWLLLRRKP